MRLVERTALLAALADGLPDGVVHWGAPVAAAADLPAADVVVAADGVGSVLRRDLFPAVGRPRALGTIAVRGVAAGPATALAETWGPGRMFGTTARLDGRTNVYACFRSDLAGPGELASPKQLLHRVYAGWHRGVVDTVEDLEEATLDARPLLDVRPPAHTSSGRTVLVGDAAHAMAPHLGRGACESLVDAVALARQLRGAPDVASALAAYDAERRRPGARLVRASRLVHDVSTARRLTGPRDLLLGAVGRVAAARRAPGAD